MSEAEQTQPQSISEIENSITTRMHELTNDLEVLGARLTPQALKSQAEQVKERGIQQAKSSTEKVRSEIDKRRSERRTAPAEKREAPAEKRSVQQATRLVDDARDGDPAALAILAGAAGALVAVTALLLVKAAK